MFGGGAEIGLAFIQSKGLCRKLGGLWESMLSLKELSCVRGGVIQTQLNLQVVQL